MTPFDDFFKANYRRMVGYCTGLGHREADVEEEVADVILKHYDEFMSKIEGPNPQATARAWMNRRVLLNLKTRYRLHANSKTEPMDDEHEVLTFDDPAEILSVKQRLPEVHPLLINDEPYGGTASAKGENTSADKTRFCRERKKFLNALNP